MPNKQIIDVNLEGLSRPLAAAVRYLAEQSWLIDRPLVIWLTLPDAARMLGIPYSTLSLWCRTGKVKTIRIGKRWRVDIDDARQYLIRNSV